jgi:hypothetical protein
MTYEEYRNKKSSKPKNNKLLKNIISKLFTIVIFSMIVIIISNYSPKFKNFLINDVLNKTMDFSWFNSRVNKVTNVFKNKETIPVIKEVNTCSKYKDGIKCLNNGNVILKSSGIVTFIGEKEGYNNTVIIQQSDGLYAWYGNINESVKLYDYLESGSVIGSSENEYYYVLLKDDKPIELNES